MPTLNWIGKEAVVRHHAEVPFRLLEEVPELSCPAEEGETIFSARRVREALIEVEAAKPPPRHADLVGWPRSEDASWPKGDARESLP